MILKHGEVVARRKLGQLPEGWEFVGYECVGTDAVLFSGNVPTIGKNGKKKWPHRKTDQKAIVTEAEAAEQRKLYEQETGNCGGCFGEGREVASVSFVGDREITYRPCRDCKGSKRPEEAMQVNEA